MKSLQCRRVAIRLLALLAFTWFALSGLVSYGLSHRIAPPRDEPIPKALRSFVTAHRLRSSDGLEFGSWYAEGREDGASIVLLHGNWGGRSQLSEELVDLHLAGHSVLAVTMRAHGDSEGSENDIGYSARHEVVRAVAFLREARPGRPIAIFGSSMGAAAALHAAGELGDDVDAYILSAPYADLREAGRRRIHRYLPPGLRHLAELGLRVWSPVFFPDIDRTRPVDAAARVHAEARLLVLVGAEDDRAPPEDARAILTTIGRGRLVLFPGLSHVSLHDGDHRRWLENVLPFLDHVAGLR